MEIFLVRHGETGGNLAHRHQVEDSPLTIAGNEQAKKVATLIKSYEPTVLVTSPLIRAVETARAIGQACDLVPKTSPYFIELRRPQHMYGHYHKSFASFVYYFQWYLGRMKQSEEMGESYQELRQRILEAKKFLEGFKPEDRVVVVSHSVFINLFIAHACQDTPLTPRQAAQTFTNVLTMPNATVTSLLFDHKAPANTCAWFKQ